MKFFRGIVPLADLSARVLRRLQALRVRTRYRLGLPEPDPREVDIAPHFRHLIDATQRSTITAHYRDLFPEAVCAELDEAYRLAAHSFTVLGHTMDYGDRIAWSRDPVSGRDWPRGFSPDIPYRGPERLGDIKFPWELNKHQYFFTLGKAAWLKNDPIFAIEIVRQIDHWIEDNPCYCGINWISALEVGTRAISWIMAFPFYEDRCERRFRRRLAKSLAQHMLFVQQHLSTGCFANTHLVGEAAALVVGGLFLNSPHSRRWLDQGLALLEQEIERQVTPDGVHMERSVAYHRFFLDHYYLVSGLFAANGRSLPAEVLSKMERMTNFLMDILFPNGSAPAFGDGDDARGLWLRADCPSDYRALLALGADLFKRGDFKAAAGGLPEEVLWLLGTEGVTRFQELTLRQPDHGSIAYPAGGYYVMRGGWGAADPVLVFDCGPLGHGPAGHGHADALSFQLFAGGFPFLVDSGTFSYNLDYSWRDAFRSTKAHNTVVVDGQDQSIPGDRMSWKSMATARCHRWLSTRWFDLVDGEHDGYLRLPDPVMHRRIVVFFKPDTWWIRDQLDGKGRHNLKFFLHLRPDCSIEEEEKEAGIILRSPEGVGLNTWILEGAHETTSPEILIGGSEERVAWFSPIYGVRVPARTLRVRREFLGQVALHTRLSASNSMTETLFENNYSFGVKVRGTAGSEDTLFFYRIGAGWPSEAEGIRFDGQILYRREIAGASSNLWAGDFRELSIAGLLEVRSPVPIESLVLENGRCEVVLPPEHATDLHIAIQEGTRLVINGYPVPMGKASSLSQR